MPGTKNTDSQLCKPRPAVILASHLLHTHTLHPELPLARALLSLEPRPPGPHRSGPLLPLPQPSGASCTQECVLCPPSSPLLDGLSSPWSFSCVLGTGLLLLVSTGCNVTKAGLCLCLSLCTFSLSSPDHQSSEVEKRTQEDEQIKTYLGAMCSGARTCRK